MESSTSTDDVYRTGGDVSTRQVADILARVWNDGDGRGIIVVDTNTPWWQPGFGYGHHVSSILVSSYGQSLVNKRMRRFIDHLVSYSLIMPPCELSHMQLLRQLSFPRPSWGDIARTLSYLRRKRTECIRKPTKINRRHETRSYIES